MSEQFKVAVKRSEVHAAENTPRAQGVEDFARFAHIASHNFKEPLRAITIFAERLQRNHADQLDARGRETVGYIVNGAKSLNEMVDGLFAYSQVDSSPLEPAPAAMNGVFEEAVFGLRESIQQAEAAITRDELPVVLGDREQLIELLQILIGNSLKFRSAEAPRIHVSSVNSAPVHTISVQDNGIGIDPAYWESVFKIFKKLHGREKYPGSGVGLAIAQKIVERHGGKIWAESRPGEGATFRFTLPAANTSSGHKGSD